LKELEKAYLDLEQANKKSKSPKKAAKESHEKC
jgi:hypothetical protein